MAVSSRLILSIGVPGGECSRSTKPVEARRDLFQDGGSTPPASIRTAQRAVRMSAIARHAGARQGEGGSSDGGLFPSTRSDGGLFPSTRSDGGLFPIAQSNGELITSSYQAENSFMPQYVYILTSLSRPNMIYTGKTSDPHRRLTEHNAGKSFHTSKHRP